VTESRDPRPRPLLPLASPVGPYKGYHPQSSQVQPKEPSECQWGQCKEHCDVTVRVREGSACESVSQLVEWDRVLE